MLVVLIERKEYDRFEFCLEVSSLNNFEIRF